MILHPDLRALREDDTPQRVAQQQMLAAINMWRAEPPIAAVSAALEGYASGLALEQCPALLALFDPQCDDAAIACVEGLIAGQLHALDKHPLGHPAMRHFTDGMVSTLLLAQAGSVTLTLAAMDGRELAQRPQPTSVHFTHIDSVERILAGSARAELIMRRPLGSRGGASERQAEAQENTLMQRRDILLRPGMVLRRSCAEQVLLIHEVSACLVTLRLQRRNLAGSANIECDLATGAETKRAAAHPQESRKELMLELLGRMGRRDAAPVMSAIAGGTAGVSLRWQALRECLALDTVTGFAALTTISRDASDPLHEAAAKLREQLVRAHPVLAQEDDALCPAC